MSVVLRPDQLDLLRRVRAAHRAGRVAVLMQATTGFGKTTAVSVYIVELVAAGMRVLFIAHLDTILEDTVERLRACGVRVGAIWAGHDEDPGAPVQVASIQTLLARGVLPPADLLIRDEAHRVMGAAERKLMESRPGTRILGLTPFPQRGDGQPLGDVFDHLESGPPARWLIEQGLLAPCDVLAPEALQEKALAMVPVVAYQRFTPGQRAIIFATNVAHAHDLMERFRASAVAAECVVGDTSRSIRRSVRARMTTGELRVLVGVGVFIEGFDLPAIETVVLARAFSVTGSYLQAIGRGLRTSPETGKTRCTVIDLRGSVHLHGLPDEDRVWSLHEPAHRASPCPSPLLDVLRHLPAHRALPALRRWLAPRGKAASRPHPRRAPRKPLCAAAERARSPLPRAAPPRRARPDSDARRCRAALRPSEVRRPLWPPTHGDAVMTLVHATLELDAATSALARVLKSLDLAADGDATVIAAVSRLAVAHRRHVLAQVVAMVGAGAAL